MMLGQVFFLKIGIEKRSEAVGEFYKEKGQDRSQNIREIKDKNENCISKLEIWLSGSKALGYLDIFLSSFKEIEFKIQITQDNEDSYVNT